jgi:hypothetical protein
VRVRLGQPEAVLRVGRRGGEAALGPGRDGVHQARGASGEHQERAQSDRRQQSPAEQVSELSRRIHHPPSKTSQGFRCATSFDADFRLSHLHNRSPGSLLSGNLTEKIKIHL